jgi:hypothetical protein
MNAASRGGLEVLQWLRAQDPPCPWCEETIAEASSMRVSRWAEENGCPRY